MEVRQRAKLLLVDDREGNLVALQAALDAPGYDLVKAHSGAEALALAKQNDFAAVLLDIQMPGLDGFETARRLKLLPRSKETPIIFITSVYTESADIHKSYEAGGVDYLGKPFDANLLRAKVKIYAELRLKTIELADKRRELESVANTILDGLLILNRGGKIVRMNDEARRIWFGAKPAPPDWDWSSPACWSVAAEAESQREAMKAALERGRSRRNSVADIRCLDGTTKTTLNSLSPLKDEAGDIVGAVWAILDAARLHKLAHASGS